METQIWIYILSFSFLIFSFFLLLGILKRLEYTNKDLVRKLENVNEEIKELDKENYHLKVKINKLTNENSILRDKLQSAIQSRENIIVTEGNEDDEKFFD